MQESVYSLEVTKKYPFENATHIQYSPGDKIYQKLPIRLTLYLVKDPEGYAFSGEPYKPDIPLVIMDINDHGKLRSYFFNFTDSGSKQVSFSDTKIYPSFTFKMPLGPNSTSQSVEEVSQFFTVKTIDPIPDGTSYFAYSNMPLSINGSSHPNAYLIFDHYNNDTARAIIYSTE